MSNARKSMIGTEIKNISCASTLNTGINDDFFSNKQVVLYFYPKDNTPGCTKEAIDFTNKQDELAALGYTVLGVSLDSLESHENFKQAHNLKIDLISDQNRSISTCLNSVFKKNVEGKEVDRLNRDTFLVKNGKVIHEWLNVQVDGHVDDVINTINKLTG